jgi:hypothetical protein
MHQALERERLGRDMSTIFPQEISEVANALHEVFHGGMALNLASAFTHGAHQRLIRSTRLPERWLGRTQATPTSAPHDWSDQV